MSHPLHHALSSVQKWGGVVEDYLPIHNWFDETKAWLPDIRHRSIRHHAEGIFWCESLFGTYITISTGKMVPVRPIAEQHIKEDLGWIPNMADYYKEWKPASWMMRPGEGRKFQKKMDEEKLDYVRKLQQPNENQSADNQEIEAGTDTVLR